MQWLNKKLDFTQGPFVMGIINCTPDSFYPGSRSETTAAALKSAERMIAGGVDILDIGGESSRPGSRPVPPEEEMERVIPVIRGIRRQAEILISIDTYKTEVAEAALDAGADIVNDIYALRDNPELGQLIARREVPAILMHMQGNPENMQHAPAYADTINEIRVSLQTSCAFAMQQGICRDKIILDPGLGFGKRLEDNLRIIKYMKEFKKAGYPLLVGISRKSFLGAVTGRPAEERLAATIAANTYAAIQGADILRVHDYAAAVDTVKVIRAIAGA